VTLHATVHFSSCNITRLASAHTVNSVQTTCRKEGHRCESAAERGKSGLGSCSVTRSLRSPTSVTELLRTPALPLQTGVMTTSSQQCHQAVILHLRLHTACLLLCLLLASLATSALAPRGSSSHSSLLSPTSKATLAAS